MTVMTALGAKRLDQHALRTIADWAAVGVAVALPWSTSATGIFIAIWLLLFVLTLDVAAVRREIATAAGGLPVLLWALAVVGMSWADAGVSWHERLGGVGGFNKLLVIPLLLAHFRQSERGLYVLLGFLASVTLLLLVSWSAVLIPGLSALSKPGLPGVLVKNYIFQGTEFLICAFVSLRVVIDSMRYDRRRSLIALGLAVAFLASIFFVATGRTELIVIPAVALWLGWRRLGWKGLAGAAVICALLAPVVWTQSSYMRDRLSVSANELQSYESSDAFSSTGLHLEFLKKSLSFVQSAPIAGHGTGSIPEQFRGAVNDTGSGAVATVNPHNQIFGVAIQLGLVGAAVLAAMWLAHFILFWSGSLIAWVGMVVVVQNIISSLFNSHLFDFSEGWLYVFAVGVAGGMILRERDRGSADFAASKP